MMQQSLIPKHVAGFRQFSSASSLPRLLDPLQQCEAEHGFTLPGQGVHSGTAHLLTEKHSCWRRQGEGKRALHAAVRKNGAVAFAAGGGLP